MANTRIGQQGITQRALATVERVGNKLPDPTLLFIALLFLVWVLSCLASYVDWGVADPPHRRASADS